MYSFFKNFDAEKALNLFADKFDAKNTNVNFYDKREPDRRELNNYENLTEEEKEGRSGTTACEFCRDLFYNKIPSFLDRVTGRPETPRRLSRAIIIMSGGPRMNEITNSEKTSESDQNLRRRKNLGR